MSPNTPPQYQPKAPVYADDIDLFELFQSLWQQKVLIVIITAVITALALVYAITITPIYKAQASLTPPSADAIQGYNEGRMEAFSNTGVKEFTPDDVGLAYLNNSKSLQLRNAIFEEVYLPSLTAEEQESSRDSLLQKFNKIVTIKQSDPENNPNLYQISIELDNPVVAAELVKQYIEAVTAATKLEFKKNIEAEQKIRINALKSQIKALLDTAKNEREDKIYQLKEALYIAESIGLEDSSPVSDKASLGGYIDNDLIYNRGAKLLRAQIEVLENRSVDEPFIKGLRELNAQLELLQAYKLDDTKVSVVTVDEAAEVPSTPIKPNKKMIVAIGIVLGGMLGVFAALVRIMICKRKSAI